MLSSYNNLGVLVTVFWIILVEQLAKLIHILLMQLLHLFPGRVGSFLHWNWSSNDNCDRVSLRQNPKCILENSSPNKQQRSHPCNTKNKILELSHFRSFWILHHIIDRVLPEGKSGHKVGSILKGVLHKPLALVEDE